MPESVSSFTNFAKLGISRQKSKLSPTFLSNRRPKIAIRKANGEVDCGVLVGRSAVFVDFPYKKYKTC